MRNRYHLLVVTTTSGFLFDGSPWGNYRVAHCEPSRDRKKIIVFGGAGDGKSTIVNSILNHNAVTTGPFRARSGSGATGVTFESSTFFFKNKRNNKYYAIVDTVGLNEADAGRVKNSDALRKLTGLVIAQEKGVAAFVMVMKADRIKGYHKKNYELFMEDIAHTKQQQIPRILVVTHFEGEDTSEVENDYLKNFAANNCHFDAVVVGRFSHHKDTPKALVEYFVEQEKVAADKLLDTLTTYCIANKQIRAPGWLSQRWIQISIDIVRDIAMKYFPDADMYINGVITIVN